MAERTVIKVDRRCCPHCDRSVSLKTYKAHRRLYYDADRDYWQRIDDGRSISPDGTGDSDSVVSSPPRSVTPTDIMEAEIDICSDINFSPPTFGRL